LKELETYGILAINWSTDLPTVTLLHERLPDDYLAISHDVYKTRKRHAEEKLNAALNFLTKDICRSVILLSYFGQQGVPCGLCDDCRSKEERIVNSNFAKEELMAFLYHTRNLEECADHLGLSSSFVKNLLRSLLLEERISIDSSGYRKI
jgi:ATP-dependent DNA helicase RecQ